MTGHGVAEGDDTMMMREEKGVAWRDLEAALRDEILGQDEALRVLVRAFARGQLGLCGPGRLRSFLLLLGETGVGKTESVLSLARQAWGDEGKVIRLDMAEYAERLPAFERLLGTGCADDGLLARELAALGGEGILLLDEIEKAHADVTRLFLGMEAARLTTSCGQKLDLSKMHVICTSNLGSESARGLAGEVPYAFVKKTVEEEAREHFSSPVFARFTDVVVYRSLGYEVQRRVCVQKLAGFMKRIRSISRISCEVDAAVVEYVMKKGFHRDLGARHLRHVIEREVGNALLEIPEESGSAERKLVVRAGRLEWN